MEYARKQGKVIFLIISGMLLAHFDICYADIISHIKVNNKSKVVFLTFDACETITPSYFDTRILDYLTKNRIPFTLFVSGKFAQRNEKKIAEISKENYVEIENHSYMHDQHMERMKYEDIKNDVTKNNMIINNLTGKDTKYFRFPAGNYDKDALKTVESLGYKVVHWTYASGDADKKVTPKKLYTWVTSKTKNGDILIFHINGRGYSTGEALPDIIKELKRKGYVFMKIEDAL